MRRVKPQTANKELGKEHHGEDEDPHSVGGVEKRAS